MNASAFDKVIGYDSVKNELKLLSDVWRNSDKYKKIGGKPPHGLLLHGDPGLGKTLFAACLIEECGLPSFTVRKDKSNGAFLDELRLAFDEAKANAIKAAKTKYDTVCERMSMKGIDCTLQCVGREPVVGIDHAYHLALGNG